jgi:hypothetical protein
MRGPVTGSLSGWRSVAGGVISLGGNLTSAGAIDSAIERIAIADACADGSCS